MSDTPLDTFFTKYESEGKYKYNKNTPINEEFGNLFRAYGWKGQAYHQVRLEYRNAVVEQFNSAYGTDLNDLNAWKHLCQIIGINPVPEKQRMQKGCKENECQPHGSFGDEKNGRPGYCFESQKALVEVFPKEQAHAGGILKYLLRKINNPYRRVQVQGRRWWSVNSLDLEAREDVHNKNVKD
ncbi:hypothetical protein BDQ17DRAFT_1414478 [Cyathus striatus]|nr:hypothetical protein BDQ17DRAFT_1414478 [Cyathus striatus]